jgi:uncharacterized protein (PEP-CTERM system associated)
MAMAMVMAMALAAANSMPSLCRKRIASSQLLVVAFMAAANAQAQAPGQVQAQVQAQGQALIQGQGQGQGGQAQQPVAPDAAADAAVNRAFSIVPRISISETLTDNALLSNSNKRSDQITEISPGLRITSQGARVKGYFDYALREVNYAQNSFQNFSQNSLNTFGNIEAIEKWAYLDFSGGISQQAISAFGTQSVGTTAANTNMTETSTYRLSPYVRGLLIGETLYELRYTETTTQSKTDPVSDVATQEGLVKLAGVSTQRFLAWTAEEVKQKFNFKAGRANESDRFKASLSAAVSPILSLQAIGGSEANNYTSVDMQRHDISGIGVKWNPSERTKLSAQRENRFFGEGHNLTFEHRTARTYWQYNDVRDVLVTPVQAGTGSIGTVYDLYFAQYASIEPDPIRRAQLVNDFLLANGLNPNASVVSNFLSTSVSVQRRQNLSVTLLGERDTVTFMLIRSETSRLDSQSTLADDLSNASVVVQNGYSLSLAHRLTPDAALNVFITRQFNAGSLASQESSLGTVNVSLISKVGRRSTVALGVRRAVFDNALTPYTETAITGNFVVQF